MKKKIYPILAALAALTVFAFAETLGKEEIDALVAALQEVAA